MYDRHIQQEYDKSTETALLEGSASYYDEKFGEIDIRTDARHGWRKNAKNSSIVFLSEEAVPEATFLRAVFTNLTQCQVSF
jgi:hypothetical protein